VHCSFAVAVCLLAGVFAACGSDEEERAGTTTQPATTQGTTAPSEEAGTVTEDAPTQAEEPPGTAPEAGETAPDEETEAESPPGESPEEDAPRGSPEDQPGGAGDEEPARSLALFTGRGGRITPRVIRVPAFIAIRVELRSADGRAYGLEFAGETIRVTGGLGSVSTTLDGLRPGRAVTGNPVGAGNRVRIEATAEPGP
jgi:hypothetical protein